VSILNWHSDFLSYFSIVGEDIDWSGLRAAAVAIGIRKAARQAACDLPPDEQERFLQRAMKRCSREKWLAKTEQIKADAVATSTRTLSANVRTGADALATALAEDSHATRIAAARAHRKATEHAANLSGQTLMDKDVAQALKHHDQGAAIVHGWSEMEQAQGAHVPLPVPEYRPLLICSHASARHHNIKLTANSCIAVSNSRNAVSSSSARTMKRFPSPCRSP